MRASFFNLIAKASLWLALCLLLVTAYQNYHPQASDPSVSNTEISFLVCLLVWFFARKYAKHCVYLASPEGRLALQTERLAKAKNRAIWNATRTIKREWNKATFKNTKQLGVATERVLSSRRDEITPRVYKGTRTYISRLKSGGQFDELFYISNIITSHPDNGLTGRLEACLNLRESSNERSSELEGKAITT